MTTILILFILGGLVGYGLKEYYQVKLGVGPHSSPPIVSEAISDFLIEQSPRGSFLDMGSGWGGLVLDLAKRLPEWQIDGIEQSPTPWFIANCRSVGKNSGNYRFFIGPMQKFALQNYDVIFINQPQRIMQGLLPKLVRALQNDTLILTYPHPLPRLPDSNLMQTDHKVRIYAYDGVKALEAAGLAVPNVPESARPAGLEQVENDAADADAASQPSPEAVQEPDQDYPEQSALPLNQTD